MAQMQRRPVMDVSPWPEGRGFSGSSEWWDYVLSKDEKQRLDNLMGVALLDTTISQRLLKERDTSLLSAFGLSDETQVRLQSINANSLVEFAQAITSWS